LAAAVLPEWIDPARAFAGGPARQAHAFWLDAGPDAREGWSWIGTGEPEPDPDVVRAVPSGARTGSTPEWGRFRGGWVGWLGYEYAAAGMSAPASPAEDAVPQALWLRVDRFVAFDHASRRAWAVAPSGEEDAFAAEVLTWATESAAPVVRAPVATVAAARHTPGEYAALVERCRGAIREGDAYQLCLTTRFSIDREVDPVDVHTALRAATPAHHGGLVRSGSVALVSASPERFLEVEAGILRTRPIKGTRPRGADDATDAALAAELLASPKERAENVMIVDLMRNDLSRICVDGTVAVDALLRVESYPAVHQLVSTVSGTLTPAASVGDILDATFPAGSMTGAPKLSAMTILHDLEHAPRGVFSGCYGWVGTDGAMDLAMVIRSVVTHPGGAYVGAGGGITWGSEPWAEVAEVGIKARGPLGAIGAVLPSGW